MKETNLDFKNLGFGYIKTDANIRYYYQDEKWDNGTLTADETLPIHIAATSLHYGQEVFEGLKVYTTKNGDIVAFRPIENYKRLVKSAEKLYMTPPTEEIYFEALNRVVVANKRFIPPYGSGATLYIRPLLIGISPQIGVHPSKDYLFMILVTPVGPYFKGGFEPIDLIVVENMDRAAYYGVGDTKAGGNYAAGLRGQFYAEEHNFSNVLYLDAVHRKYIDESGPANFLAILKDGSYVTPDSPSVLNSITNMSLREVASQDLGMKVEKRPLSIDEIDNFAEAAMCGTAAVITPVGRIRYRDKDYKFYNNGKEAGPKTKELFDRLTKIQWGEVEDTRGWLYKIKM